MTSILDIDLSATLTDPIRVAIINAIWDPEMTLGTYSHNRYKWDWYFEEWTGHCKAFNWKHQNQILPSYQDIIKVIRILAESADKTRLEIRDACLVASGSTWMEPYLNSCVNLALRLWLTIVVFEGLSYYGDSIDWHMNQTFHDFFKYCLGRKSAHVCKCVSSYDDKLSSHLDSTFNAKALERYRAVKIEWSASITEHLTLVKKDNKISLKVFHLFSLLELHRLALRKAHLGAIRYVEQPGRYLLEKKN